MASKPTRVPRELEVVVLKAMARRRKDRYATVEEMKAEILRHLDGTTLESVDYTLSQRIFKWATRHKAAVIGAVATLATLVVGLIAVLIVSVLAVQLQAATQAAAIEAERAGQQAALAAAETARAATAERLSIAETARAADAEAVAQERHELLREMRAGDYQYVLGLLEGQVRGAHNTAIEEFLRLGNAARSAGKSDEQFIGELGAEKVDEYIAAFDRLFEQHEKRGIKVTAEDYFYCGLLRHVGKRDHAGAIRDYDRAIQINPQNWQAWLNRAAATQSTDREATIHALQQAYRLCPDPAAKQQIAGYLRQFGGTVPE